MGRPIVHHDGWFFEWSTISDAPSSEAMPRDKFERWYRRKYGTDGAAKLPERLARALEHGTSYHDAMSARDLISGNRAGPDERPLSFKKLLDLVGAVKQKNPAPE